MLLVQEIYTWCESLQVGQKYRLTTFFCQGGTSIYDLMLAMYACKHKMAR